MYASKRVDLKFLTNTLSGKFIRTSRVLLMHIIYQHTCTYVEYLVGMISIGFLKIRLPCHWYERVLDVVGLEQGLEYLTGTQRVHIESCQHQNVLRGVQERVYYGVRYLENDLTGHSSSQSFEYCPYLGTDTLVEVFFYSVDDSHGQPSLLFVVCCGSLYKSFENWREMPQLISNFGGKSFIKRPHAQLARMLTFADIWHLQTGILYSDPPSS